MKCPRCGNDNPENALFCGICGNLLTASTIHAAGDVFFELPMVGFKDSVKRGFSNYFMFSGRSTRAEYWWWLLFIVFAGLILSLLSTITELSFQGGFTLATLIPGLALGSRRLHDINKTGWWQLMWLGSFLCIPMVVLIVWAIKHGDAGPNTYGIDPRHPSVKPHTSW
jgi:uncharacterized membrane protein YhaH (DUF805 family)